MFIADSFAHLHTCLDYRQRLADDIAAAGDAGLGAHLDDVTAAGDAGFRTQRDVVAQTAVAATCAGNEQEHARDQDGQPSIRHRHFLRSCARHRNLLRAAFSRAANRGMPSSWGGPAAGTTHHARTSDADRAQLRVTLHHTTNLAAESTAG